MGTKENSSIVYSIFGEMLLDVNVLGVIMKWWIHKERDSTLIFVVNKNGFQPIIGELSNEL